ncbi:hypothetical protein ACP4OV_024402 [Aristida adscensionis]
MPTPKSRSQALGLAAKADRVSSMAITGDSRDQLEVVGENVDSVGLARCLRKKFRRADIIKVEEVKDKKKEEEEKKKKDEEERKKMEAEACKYLSPYWCYGRHAPPPHQMLVCEDPTTSCHIM